jgi:hypothetical protein
LSKREAFLLRTDPKVLTALRRWARDDLRSANAQIEYLLRTALRRAGRLGAHAVESDEESPAKLDPVGDQPAESDAGE